jgi:hypothetical protein
MKTVEGGCNRFLDAGRNLKRTLIQSQIDFGAVAPKVWTDVNQIAFTVGIRRLAQFHVAPQPFSILELPTAATC